MACKSVVIGIFILGFLVFCNIRVNGRKITLSKEEDIEIDRKLRILNKPPVKTLQIDGITFDCIEIHKQPALDHPLLINHTIQMRPSSFPVDTNPRAASSTTLFGNKLERERCPPGTIIIRRTRKENLINSKLFSTFSWSVKPKALDGPTDSSSNNHHTALIRAESEDYYGLKGSLALYGVPGIPSTHGSSAFIILGRGRYNHFNAVQAGWAVSPQDYGDDRTRFTIVWTTDGYNKEGCIDLICPGFVQVDRQYTPGFAFPQLSIYNGTQFTSQIIISKDQQSGNWWLMVGSHKLPIGYWPSSLITGLADNAKLISMGGIAHAPPGEASPPMGSGHFPEEGWKKACSITGVQYMDASKNFQYPRDTYKSVDQTSCYNVVDTFDPGLQDGWAFFFGGPGGCT